MNYEGPIKTQFGYHLIKVVDIQKPGDFEALGEDERQLIRRELFQQQLDTLHTKADIEIDDGAVKKYIDGRKPLGTDEMGSKDTSHNE